MVRRDTLSLCLFSGVRLGDKVGGRLCLDLVNVVGDALGVDDHVRWMDGLGE